MAEIKQCLAWLRAHPKLFGWFVLTTLAGLRPEEAEKTEWSALNLAENFLRGASDSRCRFGILDIETSEAE